MSKNNLVHSKHARHTITLDDLSYSRLKDVGRFGESYSDLILRVLSERRILKERQVQ